MKLTRRTTLGALTGALAAPFVRPSYAQAGEIRVYNWSDYIGETTLADFEKETGTKVIYDVYASAEEMQAKLLVGKSGYDVVLQSGLSLPRMVKAGVYQKLDLAKLPGWKNLDPQLLQIMEGYDPGHAHGAPYMWGSVGITYNLDMVKERLPNADLESLDTLFKPENAAKLADCGISILDSPDDIIPVVLKYLGIEPNTAGEAEYQKAAEAFKPIRQYITTFDNANYLNTLPNGEVCAVNNWSGDYRTAKARAAEAGLTVNLAYFVPKTGSPAWFDFWSIPSDAGNVEGAHKFIDYLLRPEVIAACTNYTGYANSNAAATQFVEKDIAADPAVYPTGETMARLYAPPPSTEEQERAISRVWTTIKTGG